jgi:hypothetical protein
MKKLRLYTLLALLLMAGGVTVQAQEYLPIAQKGNEWHTFETGIWQINNYVNWCSGDTLIEDARYMKIMGTVNDSYPIFYTLLREEDGKVWKRYSIAHPETLLYDFTASVGDTLRIGDFAEEMVLDSISMVQIGDVDRRKFWFGLEYDDMGKPRAKETWVEGVGSDYGLLWSGYYGIPDGWHCLLCFHQYGELVWQNPEYNTCTYPYDAVNENKDSEISVYPNPGNNTLNICTALQNACVEVYDMNGRMIYGKEITENVTSINAEGWPSGTYIWKVLANGKEAESGIWIKQ